MGTLPMYLNRMLLVRFIIIFITVAGFAVVLDLLDTGTRVLRHTDGGTLALARYALFRLPSLVTELLPLLALLASLVTMFELIRHRELVIIWGAGVSRGQVMLQLLPAALLLCCLKFAIDDVAIPRTVPLLRAMGLSELGRVVGATEEHLWLRSGEDVIRIPSGTRSNEPIRDVLIFARDPQGRLIEEVRAATAEARAGHWLLHDVWRQPASAQRGSAVASLDYPVNVAVDKLATMTKLPRELGFITLAKVVLNDGYGVRSTESHRTWLHARAASSVMTILMLFVGVGLSHRFSRRGVALQLFGQGLSFGFLAMIGHGMCLAFGEVGLLQPELAAWAVPLLLGLYVLWSAEPSWLARPVRTLTARA